MNSLRLQQGLDLLIEVLLISVNIQSAVLHTSFCSLLSQLLLPVFSGLELFCTNAHRSYVFNILHPCNDYLLCLVDSLSIQITYLVSGDLSI